MLRRAVQRLLHEIDSEPTELYEWMLYVVWGGGGLLYITLAAGPPVSLQESMTWLSYVEWSYMNVIGPASCLIGKTLRLIAPAAAWVGLLLYAIGNGLLCVAAVSFIIGAYQTWGKAAWGPVPTTIIGLAAAGLTLRAVRALLKVETQRRRRQRKIDP